MSLWVGTFANAQDFRAIVIRKDDRFLAALPLLHRRVGGMIDAYDLPGNDWSGAGDLLLDPSEDTAALCDQLVAELAVLPRSLFWFGSVATDRFRWQQFVAALERAQIQTHLHPRYDVAWLDTQDTWQQIEAKWSSGFRRKLRKSKRQLAEAGPLRIEVLRPHRKEDLVTPLMTCLELEDTGWKGRAGTSIIRSPGIKDFILAQAKQLVEWGHVEIALLKQDAQVLACEYAWRAKDVFHPFKVAYDERYAKFGPGQLLTHMLLEQQVASPEYRGVDCMGPVTDATRRWRPELRPIGRLVFAPGPLGRVFLSAYRRLSPAWRRLREAVGTSLS
jgi:CelD/BcsL family acetyltransferase involved in cellulose biosynthesis